MSGAGIIRKPIFMRYGITILAFIAEYNEVIRARVRTFR